MQRYSFIQETTIWRGLGSATWRIDAPRDHFLRLTKDGEVIPWEKYTVLEGSTIITLKESYLRSLPNGSHTFRAEFINGFADIVFLVTGGVPRTADESSATSWMFAMMASILGLAWLMMPTRRRRLVLAGAGAILTSLLSPRFK